MSLYDVYIAGQKKPANKFLTELTEKTLISPEIALFYSKATDTSSRMFASVLNAIITQKQAYFLITRSSLFELYKKDHDLEIHNRDFKICFSILSQNTVLKLMYTNIKNKPSLFKVDHIELFKLLQLNQDVAIEQLKSCLDFINKKELFENEKKALVSKFYSK